MEEISLLEADSPEDQDMVERMRTVACDWYLELNMYLTTCTLFSIILFISINDLSFGSHKTIEANLDDS
jgi:hypothetical protein